MPRLFKCESCGTSIPDDLVRFWSIRFSWKPELHIHKTLCLVCNTWRWMLSKAVKDLEEGTGNVFSWN